MRSYTLILSRGTHVVSAPAAEIIREALAAGSPSVRIDIDLLCDGFVRRDVLLAMAHVIALVPNEPNSADDAEPARALGDQRAFTRRPRSAR